jgi:RNA-directed DNA polymerase
VAAVLQPMGLRLSEAKTRLTHTDDGFDLLGWHIQRRRKKRQPGRETLRLHLPVEEVFSFDHREGATTHPAGIHRTLADLLRRLNPAIRGWCAYLCHGVSKHTFSYLDHYAFWRIVSWLKKRHPGIGMRMRPVVPLRMRITAGKIEFFRAGQVPVTRYRYRGTRIPTPWASATA